MATKTYNGVTLTVTKRQGWTLDDRTALYFDAVNAAMPGGVVIIQGSYSSSVGASKGTHDGPGALDLKPADPNQRNTAGYKLLEKICRERGGAAWFRPWANNYHVHLIVIGTPGLPRIAANQVTAYKNKRDGLVSNLLVSGVVITTFEAWRNTVTKIGAAVSDAAKVKLLQNAVHQTADGVWGEQTDIDLRNTRAEALAKYTGAYFNKWNTDQKKRMQKSWGAYQDGLWGAATATFAKKSVIDIQRALGVTADGAWGPVTDKAYNALRAKTYAKPAPKPVVKPATPITANLAVGLTGLIHKSNLKVGKRGVEVSRYQAALWNRLPGAMRNEFIKKYSLSRKDLYDGVYGKVTAEMTKRLYVEIGFPAAEEPGDKMLTHLGFTNVKP